MANFKARNYANLQLGSTAAAHTLPDWTTGAVAHLVDAGVDAPVVTDQDQADFATGIVKSSTGAIAFTITSGQVNCTGGFSFVSTTGNECEWVAVTFGSTAATSVLAVAWDTATGLPVTPNGSDIDVLFPSGVLKEVV